MTFSSTKRYPLFETLLDWSSMTISPGSDGTLDILPVDDGGLATLDKGAETSASFPELTEDGTLDEKSL